MKFTVKFLREFEVGIDAVDTEHARALAADIVKQFIPGTTKLLSIVGEHATEEPCFACQEDGPIKPDAPGPRGGNPNKGGTPGAGTAKVEVLVDQVAKAA